MTQKTPLDPIKAHIESILAKEDLQQKKNSLFHNAFKIKEPKTIKDDNQKQQIDKNIAEILNLKNKMLAENLKPKDKNKAPEKSYKQNQTLTTQKINTITANFDQIKNQDKEPKRNLRSSQTSEKNNKKAESLANLNKDKKDLRGSAAKESKKVENLKQQIEGKSLKKLIEDIVKKNVQKPIQEQRPIKAQNTKIMMKSRDSQKMDETKFAQLFMKPSDEQIKQKPSQVKKQPLNIMPQKSLNGLPNELNLEAQRISEQRQKKKIQQFIASKNYILEGENQNTIMEERKISDEQGNPVKDRKDIQMLNQFIYESQHHIFTVTRGKVPKKTQKFIDIEVHPVGFISEKLSLAMEDEQLTHNKDFDKEDQDRITQEKYEVYERKRANINFMTEENSKSDIMRRNPNSCVYTYFRCTLVNSKLPNHVRKYCSNISILYSKLDKYKTSLRLMENIKKIQFSFVDHNYEGRYKFNGQYDGNQDEILKLRLPVEKCNIIQRSNYQQNFSENTFFSPLLQGTEDNNRKRIELLEKQLKLMKTIVNDLKTDKQRLTTMYEREKQTKENLYNQLSSYRQKQQSSPPALPFHNTVQQDQKHPEQLQSLQSPPLGLSPIAIEIESQRQKHSNLSNLPSKQPAVEVLEIDDDSGSLVMEDVDSNERGSSGEDSYYKEKNQRDYKNGLGEIGLEEPRSRKGRPKRQRAVVPELTAFEHQVSEPGKFVHAVNGRMFSTSQILAFNSTSNESHRGQQYMSSARHISATNNNSSFYTSRGGGRHRTFRSSGGPQALNERKLSWQQWARKTNNEVIKSIVQEESQFTECKKFIKSSQGLLTMGFMELFHGVLEIILSDNKIQKIEGLFNMKKLRKLELNNNLIERIEELDENKELKELFLRDNKITKIENVFHLKKLEALSLASNEVTVIPQQIGELVSLKAFYISKNNLQKLSMGLLSLPLLKMFRVFENPRLNLNDRDNKYILDELEKKGKVSTSETF